MIYPITELLPHRPPFLFIDRMEEATDDASGFRAVFTPQKDTLFYDEALGGLPAYVGVEIIAQAIGAFVGYTDKVADLPQTKVGKLLLIRDFNTNTDVLRAGEELILEASCIMEDPPVGVFRGVMKRGDDILMETELTVYKG